MALSIKQTIRFLDLIFLFLCIVFSRPKYENVDVVFFCQSVCFLFLFIYVCVLIEVWGCEGGGGGYQLKSVEVGGGINLYTNNAMSIHQTNILQGNSDEAVLSQPAFRTFFAPSNGNTSSLLMNVRQRGPLNYSFSRSIGHLFDLI